METQAVSIQITDDSLWGESIIKGDTVLIEECAEATKDGLYLVQGGSSSAIRHIYRDSDGPYFHDDDSDIVFLSDTHRVISRVIGVVRRYE